MAAVTQVRILVTAVTFSKIILKYDLNIILWLKFVNQPWFITSVSGIVVSIAAFQAVDPGSIPG